MLNRCLGHCELFTKRPHFIIHPIQWRVSCRNAPTIWRCAVEITSPMETQQTFFCNRPSSCWSEFSFVLSCFGLIDEHLTKRQKTFERWANPNGISLKSMCLHRPICWQYGFQRLTNALQYCKSFQFVEFVPKSIFLINFQLQTIIETDLKYSVLENILIENIQDFAIPISAAYDTITKRPYDHLDFR